MRHSNLETAIKEITQLWDNNNAGKMPDERGKCAFMFGCLKNRYEKMYEDLPDGYKEGSIGKYVRIDANTRLFDGIKWHWNGDEWISETKKSKHQKSLSHE